MTDVDAGGRSGWGVVGDRPGRIGMVFIGAWTLFLLQPLHAAWLARDTWRGWAGIVLTLAYAGWYLYAFAIRRSQLRGGAGTLVEIRSATVKIGVALALALALTGVVGQAGEGASVYLTVLFVISLPFQLGLPLALLNGLGWYLAGVVIPDWTREDALLLSNLAAGMAVLGIAQVINRNAALLVAQHENQRLAVSEERNRFARDLHDILGHSLTVITLKAQLANRLLDVDTARARQELAELERLSRDALADVRRAVEGYRELTLPGEIARARSSLTAGEIAAALPSSTDEVPGDLRELFAWAVREGVTNVLRHCGARTCAVVLTERSVEVRDDGRGGPIATGNGLLGLRERAAALGATVVTEQLDPGFSLKVVVT